MKMKSFIWSVAEVHVLVAKNSQLKNLVTLSLADSALGDVDVWTMLPFLQNLKCLDLSGKFGDNYHDERNSLLTDSGLEAIACSCPHLQSLDLSYQRQGTISGVRTLLDKCSDLVELDAANLQIGVQHVVEILGRKNKLIFFGCSEVPASQQFIVQNAIVGTGGRTIVGNGMFGPIEVTLPKNKQKNRDRSMAKMTKAHEQQSDPNCYNKWDGVL